MTKQGTFAIGRNVNGEGGAILQIFRLLSDEEQRIAYAVLNGMRLQKDLDSQTKTGASTRAGA